MVFFIRPPLRDFMSRDTLRLPAMQKPSPGDASVEETVHVSAFFEGFGKKELSDRDIAAKLAEEDPKKFAEVLKIWLK